MFTPQFNNQLTGYAHDMSKSNKIPLIQKRILTETHGYDPDICINDPYDPRVRFTLMAASLNNGQSKQIEIIQRRASKLAFPTLSFPEPMAKCELPTLETRRET